MRGSEHFSKVVCVCGEFRSIFSVIFAKFEFSREGPDALLSLPQGKKDPRMHSHKSMDGFRKYLIHSIEPKTGQTGSHKKRTRMT